jgi:hypothetical protein
VAYLLNLIARKYKMTISSTNSKSMAMWENHIQRVKIVINHNIIELVTDFNPLKAKLNPICHLLALLGAYPIFYVSRIRVNISWK